MLCHHEFVEYPVKYLNPQYHCLLMALPAGHSRNYTKDFREAWPFSPCGSEKPVRNRKRKKKRKEKGKKKKKGRKGLGDIALRDETPAWDPPVRRGLRGAWLSRPHGLAA